MNPPRLILPARFSRGPWPTAVAAAALTAVVAVVVVRLVTNMVEPGLIHGAAGDFRDATYLPARALLDGVNPYDPVAYLSSSTEIGEYFPAYGPHHLLVHLPLAALSLNTAIAVYAVLTIVLTVILARVSLSLAGWEPRPPIVLGTAALLLASNPGRANFVDLQPTILIILGAYLVLSNRHTEWVAAIGVALTFLKPQFGVPLVIILFFIGRAAAASRGILVAAAASAPIVARLIDIEDGIGGVIEALGDNLQYAADTSLGYLRVDLVSVLRNTSPMATAAVALLVLGVAVLSLRSKRDLTSPASLVIATSAILLALFHVNYDLLLLTWPILALAAEVARDRLNRLQATLLIALLLLLFNPLTSSFAIVNVGPQAILGTVSGLVLLAVLGLAIALQIRNRAAGTAVLASGNGQSTPE